MERKVKVNWDGKMFTIKILVKQARWSESGSYRLFPEELDKIVEESKKCLN